MLVVQDVFAARGDHMQAKAGVLEHFANAPAIKGVQALAKRVTHLLRTGAALASRRFVALVDVVVLQALKALDRMVQACCGHAPRANRGTHQVDRLGALGQPFAKQKTVEWPQDQALGATCSTRNDPHVLGLEAMVLEVGPRFGASEDMQGFQGVAWVLFLQ